MIVAVPAHAGIWKFTNANSVGRFGPTQAMADAHYAGTSLAGQVTVNRGIQQWVIQTSGTYTITASGASGGETSRASGGRGAEITIQRAFSAGDIVNVLVGQKGGLATFGGGYGGETGGGGGGSFLVDQAGNPILIAGGGGGAAEGRANYNYVLDGVDASDYFETFGQNGTSSPVSWSQPGVGGTNGRGGAGSASRRWGGAGGGGFFSNGQEVTYSGEAGQSYLNGGLGGINKVWFGSFIQNIDGGFGGGAGAGIHRSYESNAGGGGGYSGGGGGNTRVGSGGGGGNYYAGNFISSDYNVGHGQVLFQLNAVPEPGSLAIFGTICLVGMVRRRQS